MKEENSIEISNKILRTFTIQSKSDKNIKLSKDDIKFIKSLAANEFKTNQDKLQYGQDRILHDLCIKFRVTSFEEIIRKIIFYKLIKLNLSDDYLTHIKIFTKIRIAKTLMLRQLILQTTCNIPEKFYKFCQKWQNINLLGDINNELPILVKTINNDDEIQNTFKKIDLIAEEFNQSFDLFFNILFPITNLDKIDSNNIALLLKKHSAKYLYICANILFDTLPNRTRREETTQECRLLKFLLYDGDEIDYMEIFQLSIANFNDLMAKTLFNHRETKQQEVLNSVYLYS